VTHPRLTGSPTWPACPDELRRDPAALVRAATTFGRMSADLLRDLASEDEATRAAAAARWEALQASFPESESPQVKRPALNRVLRDLVARLEVAAEQARQDEPKRPD
jgi:hypothetical protein